MIKMWKCKILHCR